MCFIYVVGIHKRQKVIGKLTDGERSTATQRFSVPASIQSINMIISGKLINLSLEIVTVLTVPVQQNQRLTLALLYVVMLNIHATKLQK